MLIEPGITRDYYKMQEIMTREEDIKTEFLELKNVNLMVKSIP